MLRRIPSRLFVRLGHQPTTAVVIHQDQTTNRHVQLMIGHGMAYAEASSNAYLTGPSRLSPLRHEALAGLGRVAPPDDDGAGAAVANWTLPVVRGDGEALAQVVLATVPRVLSRPGRMSALAPMATTLRGGGSRPAVLRSVVPSRRPSW